MPKRGDKDFEPLRMDKTKILPPTKRELEISAFNTAVKMMQDFRYQPGMSRIEVVGKNGERIDSNGQIYIPKFKRK